MKRVALLLNINKPYDRQIIHGVSRYAKESGDWSLYIEDEPLQKIPDFEHWQGDGIIADLDDVNVYNAVKKSSLPVIGCGSGYGPYQEKDDIPYVYTDNDSIAILAANHLLERGFKNFAYYGIPESETSGWNTERQNTFSEYLKSKGIHCNTYSNTQSQPAQWSKYQQELASWLNSLQKPVALLAANDSRARHILEACRLANLNVPSDVAVVGVDDDPLMCEVGNPPLTSVTQGTDKLGYEASRMLDKLMRGESIEHKTIIEPLGITVRESSDILAIENELIAQALKFIHTNAKNCIRVEDVAHHCSVSRSSLEKKFKTVMNHSVHYEITLIQLANAKELLSKTDLPIKRVAEQTGFSTVQYLNMKLKKDSGLTPKLFRMKSRQKIS
ncbi:MAG: XylR family transcriptional regulator [Lentisphaeraceae bacterium]|nr:XylR family transcriptional regulator [Lentisphaeraceae bacterium]